MEESIGGHEGLSARYLTTAGKNSGEPIGGRVCSNMKSFRLWFILWSEIRGIRVVFEHV